MAAPFVLAVTGVNALTISVNSPGDVPDINPGNGVCETAAGNGVCTLRAAIQEANALTGADIIVLQPNVTYTLTRAGQDDTALNGDLDVLDSVTIMGGGPTTVIDGNGTATGDRVLHIVGECNPGGKNNMGNCINGDLVVNISSLTIKNGQYSNVGGGINSNGTLTLTNVTVTNNTINGLNDWGGGIYNSGTLTIDRCTISNNISGTHNPFGGGIYNQGPLTITNSTISGNKTGDNTKGSGGGIFTVGATVTIKNCAITGNTAFDGGGIYKLGPALVVMNSTISGNFSTRSGAGIFASTGSGVNATSLFNVTITGNTANSDNAGVGIGGGVANDASNSTLNFQNSIIAGNSTVVVTGGGNLLSFDDCSGTISSLTNNIMQNVNSSYCTVTGPVTIADPNLGPLQDNGGSTFTHAPQSGSPVIDSGNSSGCTDNLGALITTDQRGLHRPEGTRCDEGAFEVQRGALVNVSSRLPVGTGDDGLFAGFIVTGTQPKRVIILATGSSLPFPDKLANPTLDLFQGSTFLESNDNWGDSANKQAIIDSGFAPGSNLESAIIRTLPANNSQYSAIVHGVNNGTGIGVVQIYDLDRSVDSKLANISTRGVVQTGDNVLIGATIVLGETTRKVIVRGIGPSLNVPGKLTDPTLQLVNQQGTIVDENDNWAQSPNKQAILDSGVAPTNDSESAIIATLLPGGAQYSAVVRGVSGATGVAVVDVFVLN
jgi:CSLREA domain-containing protein